MKKIIMIYVIGVIIAWYPLFNIIKRDLRDGDICKVTYGDVLFTSALSLGSWCTLVSTSAIYVVRAIDFSGKPFC